MMQLCKHRGNGRTCDFTRRQPNDKNILPDLAKCALDLSKEVVIRDLRCRIIHVVDSKTQSLNLFKIVINFERTREFRTQRILNILSSTNLQICAFIRHHNDGNTKRKYREDGDRLLYVSSFAFKCISHFQPLFLH